MTEIIFLVRPSNPISDPAKREIKICFIWYGKPVNMQTADCRPQTTLLLSAADPQSMKTLCGVKELCINISDKETSAVVLIDFIMKVRLSASDKM